jgi:hypothetical protein
MRDPSRIRCALCRAPQRDHIKSKCLYGPGVFTVTVCPGCQQSISIDEVRVKSGRQRFTGMYHAECYMRSPHAETETP